MESEEKPTRKRNFDQRTVDTGGGAYIGGGVSLVGGDFVGRDKVIHGDEIRGDKIIVGNISDSSGVDIGRSAQVFASLINAVQSAMPEQSEAIQTVQALQAEVGKGKEADDFKVAELIERFYQLELGMSNQLLAVFAEPVVKAITGPATRYVLRKHTG